ncbi:ROK family protein [Actinoplanes sp. CA-015351]|uniref:ROK family protein n=1 Tax=Actinoplanes sp. CA-015351 TaxID=3239897 RepID=UPI003D95CAD7
MIQPAARTTRRGDLPVPGQRRQSDSAGAVLRAVLDYGPIARSSIARATRLSAASVTGLAASLLEHRLIREVPEAAGPPGIGRPHVPLDIDGDAVAVIGVHIAVPRTTVALLDLRGRVLAQRQDLHRDKHPDSVIAALIEGVATLRREHGARRRVLALGLATGGWVDSFQGTVVEHPALGWNDVPIGAALAGATGLPVRIDSNSRALLRAEQLFGAAAAQARGSAVLLFVGNVVDVAFSSGGVIHQGPRSAAGAVAHLPVEGCDEVCSCGRTGCLQAAVSERVLVRRALAANLIARPDIHGIVDAARDGSAAAFALLEERARLVGRAAALLHDLFDPEVLFVAEGGANRLPEPLETVRAQMRPGVADTVRASSFPSHVLATAGGAVALDHVYAAPL